MLKVSSWMELKWAQTTHSISKKFTEMETLKMSTIKYKSIMIYFKGQAEFKIKYQQLQHLSLRNQSKRKSSTLEWVKTLIESKGTKTNEKKKRNLKGTQSRLQSMMSIQHIVMKLERQLKQRKMPTIPHIRHALESTMQQHTGITRNLFST